MGSKKRRSWVDGLEAENFCGRYSAMSGGRGELQIDTCEASILLSRQVFFSCLTGTRLTAPETTAVIPQVLQTHSSSSLLGLQGLPHHHCLFCFASLLLCTPQRPRVPWEMASVLMAVCSCLFRCLNSPVVQSSGPGIGTMSKTISALKKRLLAAA